MEFEGFDFDEINGGTPAGPALNELFGFFDMRRYCSAFLVGDYMFLIIDLEIILHK